jgi:tetratricopeptide (TPR) repeat protein
MSDVEPDPDDHRRAADRTLAESRFSAAAQHLLHVGEGERATALLYEHCDDELPAGRVDEVESLAMQIQRSVPPDYRLDAILGSCDLLRGRYRSAESHWLAAIERVEAAPDKAALLVRLGDTYRLSSFYEQAREAYSEASALAGAGDGADLARQASSSGLGLAKLARLQASYPEAISHYEMAHASFEELGDPVGLMETDFGLGEVRRLLGDWNLAAASYEMSLDRALRAGNLERQAYGYWGVGEIERLHGDLGQARVHHRRGLELCSIIGDTRSMGWALLGLAETERETGNLERSDGLYREAQELFDRTRSATELSHVLLGMAELHRARGTADPSLYDQAATTYLDLQMSHCLAQCAIGKALALLADSGTGAEVEENLASARRIVEQHDLAREREILSRLSRDSDREHLPVFQLNFP